MQYLPEEILIGIIDKLNRRSFPLKNYEIQNFIFKMKNQDGFKELLSVFRFCGSPAAPYSEILDNALFNLQYSKKIKRGNPDLVEYEKAELFEEYKDMVLGKFEQDDLEQIELIASELSAILPAMTLEAR